MAGKPNPLLSRHKKHRGADLTVTFHVSCLHSPNPVSKPEIQAQIVITGMTENMMSVFGMFAEC